MRLNKLTNTELKELFTEALLNSYQSICQVFPKESFNREKTDKSFNEVMNEIIDDKFKHAVAIKRKVINEHYDLEHYEFGLSNNDLYLSIQVRVDLAEKILSKHIK